MIYFNEEIDLTDYIDLNLNSESTIIYQLYGDINHKDSLEFGHYYSYIKFFYSNEWYEFNDTEVNELGKDLLDCPYAYSLIYIKK